MKPVVLGLLRINNRRDQEFHLAARLIAGARICTTDNRGCESHYSLSAMVAPVNVFLRSSALNRKLITFSNKLKALLFALEACTKTATAAQ
jgi:hypothetical protein